MYRFVFSCLEKLKLRLEAMFWMIVEMVYEGRPSSIVLVLEDFHFVWEKLIDYCGEWRKWLNRKWDLWRCRGAQISGAPPTKTDGALARGLQLRWQKALKERQQFFYEPTMADRDPTRQTSLTCTEVHKTWEWTRHVVKLLVVIKQPLRSAGRSKPRMSPKMLKSCPISSWKIFNGEHGRSPKMKAGFLVYIRSVLLELFLF